MFSNNRISLLHVILGILGLLVGWIVAGWFIEPAHSATMTTRCVVGNRECFVLRVGSGNLSAAKRMDLVNDRLAGVLGTANGNSVRIMEDDSANLAIFINHTMIVTVTEADAKVNETTVKALAVEWAARLYLALK